MKDVLRPIDILLIDDNEDDILIVKRIFKKLRTTNSLHAVQSGEAGLDYLRGRGSYSKVDMPVTGLILLDISMPGMDGFAVLEEMKADPELRKIPVIMLTTSSEEEDVVRSFKGGACSFITKPVKKEEFFTALEQLSIYWTMVTKRP